MANVQVEISAKIDQFQKKLDEAKGDLKSFATDAGSSLKSLGTAIQSIAIPAGLAAGAIAAIGLSAVKSYGRLQSLEKGLEAVSGSSEAAKKQLNDLREVAALPGLGLEEAIRGSISLQAIGISASDAKEAILQFGNAVATVGKGRAELDRALYGLQQLANTDFPLGEDLNIIKDAIPQVSKLLTEAFGANRSDELARMGITSKQVTDTIIQGLSELPRVAGGVENAIENMQDGFTEAWQELGKAINETLGFEEATNKLGDAVGGLTDWFRGLRPEAQSMIVYIGAGAAAFFGLLAALGAIVTIAPIVFSSITLMTGGIAAVTAAVAIAAVAIINNWERISMAIQEHNVKVLYNLSRFSGALAEIARLTGATKTFVALNAASNVLSISSKNLSNNIDKTKEALFEASNATYAEIAASKSLEVQQEKVKTKIDGTTESVKRMSLEIWKLNGIIALNGKEFKRNPLTPTIGSIDRGSTLDIPEVQVTGIITQAQALAMDAADVFNDYFSSNIGSIIGEGLSGIATGIGNAIADGGNVIEAFGKGVLGAFGNFLSEFGEKLIAYGIAAGAFAKLQLAMANPLTAIVAAPLAIAAGAALMIAGAAATRSASGGTAGQGSSSSQNFTTGTVVEPRSQESGMELVIRGGDIYRVNKQYEKSLGYGG